MMKKMPGTQIEPMVVAASNALAVGVEYESHIIHTPKSLTMTPPYHFQRTTAAPNVGTI